MDRVYGYEQGSWAKLRYGGSIHCFCSKKLETTLGMEGFRIWTNSVLIKCALFFVLACVFVALQLSVAHDRRPKMLSMKSVTDIATTGISIDDIRTGSFGTNNFTETILRQLRINGTTPCHNTRTYSTKVVGLPNQTGNDTVPILTVSPFTFLFISVSENGTDRCAGGDFYETDLAGDHWKSRPPVTDHGNGSYSVTIVVHPAFPGVYNFTAYLLFDNLHGLDHEPQSWALMRKAVSLQFRFVSTKQIPDSPLSSNLHVCRPADFRDIDWHGRWTRGWFNESCEADEQGRFRCIPEEHEQCSEGWCDGRVSILESNGWVYSKHCAFHLWDKEEAWNCLSGKWIFVWGDSNMPDVVRNLLLFVLGIPVPQWTSLADWSIDRALEEFFINPTRPDQFIHISIVFNGHHETYNNGLGLDSLLNHDYSEWLLRHFNGSLSPDIFIMNSGLHDGVHFETVEEFVAALDYTARFWNNIFDCVTSGRRPTMVLRTAVAPAGYSRVLPSNPHKMEVFNALMAERLRNLGDLHVIDAFDPTFPFHFDYSCSDGGHYGHPPKANRWPWLGKPHQYFVDLMLVHIMLNSICS